MTRPNDVDFCFQLWPHDWSTARLWIDREFSEFQLSYVFNDPLESLLQSTIRLANGESTATIEWSDEPGTFILKFAAVPNEHHLLSIELSEYSSELPVHASKDLIKTTNFFVVRKYWLHLVVSELQKIAESFSHQHYREARNYTFPRTLYNELQAVLKAKNAT